MTDEIAAERENLAGRGGRKSAAIAEKFEARVAKPDAKPDAPQASRPVSQTERLVLSADSVAFGASWQDYEQAMAAKWGGFAVPANPSKGESGVLPADAAGAEAGERE